MKISARELERIVTRLPRPADRFPENWYVVHVAEHKPVAAFDPHAKVDDTFEVKQLRFRKVPSYSGPDYYDWEVDLPL